MEDVNAGRFWVPGRRCLSRTQKFYVVPRRGAIEDRIYQALHAMSDLAPADQAFASHLPAYVDGRRWVVNTLYS
jgi:hypothetical protein